MTEQLKPLPCPFCGRTDIRAHVYGGGEPDAFMQCHDCSADGPNGLNRAGAIAAWNRRAQPAQAVPMLTDEEIKKIGGLAMDSPYFGIGFDFARAIEAAVRAKMGVAVPMTDEQIDAELDGSWVDDAADFEAGIRAAERFHGIVGKEGA